MADRLTRRDALELALLAAGGLALTGPARAAASTVRARRTTQSALASDMRAAAARFLDSLGGEARRRATYPFENAERVRWHWTTPERVPRNGLPLGSMTRAQRQRALELLRVSSSAMGYRKSLDIVRLQGVLRQAGVSGSSFDPQRYYVTVFGDPEGDEPWAWRFEGHHLSRHYTVVRDRVGVYPFFLGAWPTRATSAYGGLPRGYRTMPREEDAARAIVRSLGGRERRRVIFQAASLTDHVTQNRARVAPLEPIGMAVGELGPRQRRLAVEIVGAYLGVLPAVPARRARERIERAGIDRIRFAWAGALVPNEPHYYRLQGPTFLLEFDNSRNDGTHIHSVWRDFREDFGENLV
jgi:Protein of unknown function (DUF3500)